MWAMKVKVREKWNPYNYRCKKFGVKIYFYSLNNYKKNGGVYVLGSGIVQGEEKNKKSFFASLRKDKKVVKVECNGDFFIGTYRETEMTAKERGLELAYSPSIIHLKPVIFYEDGWEEWEFASFERSIFENILSSKRITSGDIEFKLSYFKDKKIKNIMPLNIAPELTKKQMDTFALAVKEGYYDSPRKTDLVNLSKKAGSSISNYQVHLRKAEKKIIPFVFGNNLCK
ncbi:MAG: helix-turn-helix domain-containing protein [Candidatus Pacearchaeota archaeon]|jgi:predicted DNA binding protein